MSAETANSQFSFHLPSMSYINASWEEPNLHTQSATASGSRRIGLTAWLARQIATMVAMRRNRVAAAELALMSDRELTDIGVTRSDLARVFEPALNQDLRQRA